MGDMMLSEIRASKHVNDNAINTRYAKVLAWRIEVNEQLLKEAKDRMILTLDLGHYSMLKNQVKEIERIKAKIDSLSAEMRSICG